VIRIGLVTNIILNRFMGLDSTLYVLCMYRVSGKCPASSSRSMRLLYVQDGSKVDTPKRIMLFAKTKAIEIAVLVVIYVQVGPKFDSTPSTCFHLYVQVG
jgi:hypothetical protein